MDRLWKSGPGRMTGASIGVAAIGAAFAAYASGAERVPVELGLVDARLERAEVRAGLAAGDTLLIGVAQAVTPGTPVVVSRVTAAASR